MGTRTIFTIGRQFGSGGRMVGKKLAEALCIPYYDKELLAMAAKDSGYSEELFRNADEKPASSLLYSLVMGNYPMSSGTLGFNEMPLNDQLFLIQSNTIRKVASKGSCIIIGRCGDYILKDDPDLISVFIHAPLEARVKRAVDVYGIPADRAEDICLKNDKSRANFYNYYSDRKWGMCRTYSISLDSSLLGIDGCVEEITRFKELSEKHRDRGI